MSDFRQLSETVWASPQIDESEVANVARLGFAVIINNRPDGEVDDQPVGEAIAQAASEAGMDYCSIPITHAGFDETQIDAMCRELESASGPILAYCRSGTRSTFLWALARCKMGDDPRDVAGRARAAGYDVSSILPVMESLHRVSSN